MRTLSIIKKNNGGTIIEFALVFPMFLLILFFIIEMALINMSAVAMENAVIEASRDAKVGVPVDVQQEIIKQSILDNAHGLISPERLFVTSTVDPTAAPPTNASDVGPERCVSPDGVWTGAFCPCPTGGGNGFMDSNLNGICDGNRALNLGTDGAVVRYAAVYHWRILTPLIPISSFFNAGKMKLGDEDGVVVLFSGSAVRNEPTY